MTEERMSRAAKGAVRTRRRSLSRQDELFDEAARQLNARGVSLTSLTEIADGLGVARTALYYYVDDREDLVFKVYRRSIEVLARHLGEAARSGRPALDVVEAFVSAALDPTAPEIAALSEIGLLRGPERETVLALYEGVVARLSSVLETGAKAGEIRDCDFEIAARCTISMIYWVPLAGRWSSADPVERSRIVARVCELIRMGVATNRAQLAQPLEIDVTPLLPAAVVTLDQEALRDAKRETILLAASRLFNAKGVDTTSLDEIAAAVDATARALYRYVGDKAAIVQACYERSFQIAIFISDQADRLGVSAFRQLDAQQRAHARVQQNRDICPLRHLSGFEALSSEARAAVAHLARRLTEAARRRACQAQSDGEMRPIDVDEFLLLAAGPSAWLAKPLIEFAPQRQIEVANTIADFVRIGLAPVSAR